MTGERTQGNAVNCAPVRVESIDPAACTFTLQGQKLCYLSRGRLRMLAKSLGLSLDGVKLDLFKRIVHHLEQNGSPAELDGAKGGAA